MRYLWNPRVIHHNANFVDIGCCYHDNLQSHNRHKVDIMTTPAPWYLTITLQQWNNYRADSMFAPSQWETALLCNDVSHWLGANLESARNYFRRKSRFCRSLALSVFLIISLTVLTATPINHPHRNICQEMRINRIRRKALPIPLLWLVHLMACHRSVWYVLIPGIAYHFHEVIRYAVSTEVSCETHFMPHGEINAIYLNFVVARGISTGGHYRVYYPGTLSSLWSHCNSVMESTSTRSSNELQLLDHTIGYQPSSPSNGHQGNMPHHIKHIYKIHAIRVS